MSYKIFLECGHVFDCDVMNYTAPVYSYANIVVSNTGYQEAISDISWLDSCIIFSAVHVGTVGITNDDFESAGATVKAIIIKQPVYDDFHHNSELPFKQFANNVKLPVVHSLDIRRLIKSIVQYGQQKICIISNEDASKQKNIWSCNISEQRNICDIHDDNFYNANIKEDRDKNVCIINMGSKHHVARILNEMGINAHVISYSDACFNEIKDFDGYIISSGPGDPEQIDNSIFMQLLELNKPIFGICLGHQILSLMRGHSTYKLPGTGNHCANHPIINIESMEIFNVSQNHNFAVKISPEVNSTKEIYRSYLDNVNQGISYVDKPVFSVQYHPEGSPGPLVMSDFKKFYNYLYAKNS